MKKETEVEFKDNFTGTTFFCSIDVFEYGRIMPDGSMIPATKEDVLQEDVRTNQLMITFGQPYVEHGLPRMRIINRFYGLDAKIMYDQIMRQQREYEAKHEFVKSEN